LALCSRTHDGQRVTLGLQLNYAQEPELSILDDVFIACR